MRNEGWEESIVEVLRVANEPMHYLKITEDSERDHYEVS